MYIYVYKNLMIYSIFYILLICRLLKFYILPALLVLVDKAPAV